MDLLGILGIILSIGIAVFEWSRARAAEHKRADAEAQRDALIRDLPHQISSQILPKIGFAHSTESVVESAKEAGGSTDRTGTQAGIQVQNGMAVHNALYLTSTADVDGDGKDELLVQYPAGAHGTALKVFGWREHEFTQIGELGMGHASGFDVYDFDGDGRIEIGALDPDWRMGENYASAPLMRTWYRWNGDQFVEIEQIRFLPEDEPGEPSSAS